LCIEGSLEHDPRAGRLGRGLAAHDVQDLRDGVAADVDPVMPRIGGQLDVGVAVDQAGDDGAAGEVDVPCAVAGRGEDLGVTADRGDPVAAHGHRGRGRAGRIHGDNPAAGEDDVGLHQSLLR
jgi:hypothetical protein